MQANKVELCYVRKVLVSDKIRCLRVVVRPGTFLNYLFIKKEKFFNETAKYYRTPVILRCAIKNY